MAGYCLETYSSLSFTLRILPERLGHYVISVLNLILINSSARPEASKSRTIPYANFAFLSAVLPQVNLVEYSESTQSVEVIRRFKHARETSVITSSPFDSDSFVMSNTVDSGGARSETIRYVSFVNSLRISFPQCVFNFCVCWG
jgi:hypothetical protein